MATNKVEIIENGVARTLMDVSGDTATPETVAEGETFHGADGEEKVGILRLVTVDSELSETSTNPVQNAVVAKQFGELSDQIDDLKENGTGTDGEDGFSPIATVTQTDTGASISIQDKNGTTTAEILHGTDGADGEDGLTPYIGANGNWWIGDTDTGTAASGEGSGGGEWELVYKNIFENVTSVEETIDGLSAYNKFKIGLQVNYDSTLEGQDFKANLTDFQLCGCRIAYYNDVNTPASSYSYAQVMSEMEILSRLVDSANRNKVLYRKSTYWASNQPIFTDYLRNNGVALLSASDPHSTVNNIKLFETIGCSVVRDTLILRFSEEVMSAEVFIFASK